MPVTISNSLSHITTDPIRNFKFHVDISYADLDLIHLGFMSVSGINLTTEVIPYRQGGYNTTPQKLPGQSDFSPLTLSRGVLLGTDQTWRWTKSIFATLQGSADTATAGHNFRASAVDLKVFDHPVTKGHTPVKLWIKFYNAWISSISYSDLDAGGNGFMVEQITLVHEGFDVGWATTAAGSEATQPLAAA